MIFIPASLRILRGRIQSDRLLDEQGRMVGSIITETDGVGHYLMHYLMPRLSEPPLGPSRPLSLFDDEA